jgi:tRNA1Val (adenine37-N6)-methyltransferase
MGNTYFACKQFTVHQHRTAMKVCTDACLFGAWVATLPAAGQAKRILDIGTGTGLLSLMVAQATPARIEAIEIDADAAGQATDNFNASPFAHRLQVTHTAAQQWVGGPYDLVMANPPFYENDLHSTSQQRNTALHSTQLNFDALLQCINNNVHEGSSVAVLLPYARSKAFIQQAAGMQLQLQQQVNVRQTEKHPYFRSMLLFGYKHALPLVTELCIKQQNQYTPQFAALLQPYYLYL